MLSAINNLREIARCCQAGETLDANLASWLGSSLEQFLVRRYRTIEDALGLRAARGGVPWWLEDAMRQRDASLRRLAERFFGSRSSSAQAKQIRLLAVRYSASAWRHDRDNEEMPEGYRGKPSEWLWRAFKSGAPMPICERQLRHILHH